LKVIDVGISTLHVDVSPLLYRLQRRPATSYSVFTPYSPVIFAHLVVSAAIMAPNAAGVMTIGVALTSASRVFTAESARPALISQPGQFGFRVKQGIR